MAEAKTVRAVMDAFVGTPTGDIRVSPGDEWPADDPFVAGNPALFGAPASDKPVRQRRGGRPRVADLR